jgi:hypothetical protein
LVLDALEEAFFTRAQEGVTDLSRLVALSLAGGVTCSREVTSGVLACSPLLRTSGNGCLPEDNGTEPECECVGTLEQNSGHLM